MSHVSPDSSVSTYAYNHHAFIRNQTQQQPVFQKTPSNTNLNPSCNNQFLFEPTARDTPSLSTNRSPHPQRTHQGPENISTLSIDIG